MAALTFSTRAIHSSSCARPGLQAQLVHHQAVQPLVAQIEGDQVDVGRVDAADDGSGLDVGEQRDLLFEVLADGPIGAADDDVGLDTDAPQFVHAVLRGLGLELAARVDERDQRHVDVENVAPPDVVAELPDGLQEGQALDVAHRAADLGDHHVDLGIARHPGDALLDLVGDVRDHLHGAAQVVALAFLADDVVVDGAGGDVGVAREALVDEPLVVAQVEVGLGPVVGDEDLTVLEGAHRAWVDVEVGVELLDDDPKAPALEQTTQGGGGDALAQRGHNSTCDEYVLSHAHPYRA